MIESLQGVNARALDNIDIRADNEAKNHDGSDIVNMLSLHIH